MDEVSLSVTLGQKYQVYNACVKGSEEMGIPIISESIIGDDVDKLMLIDIACFEKNLPFVLHMLTDEDILYVSRVIKQSTWLITDPKFAIMISPEYLRNNLYPKMTSKAIAKLKKHIKLNLKDEVRAEAFYNDENDIKKRLKWLLNCSLPFIEEEVKKHAAEINLHLFKRLCEKSTTIFEILTNDPDKINKATMEAVLFILYKDTDKYLDAVEKINNTQELPKFGVKGTQVAMKYDPNRIVNNIDKYLYCIDVRTFAKCLKTDQLKDVIYKLAYLHEKYELRYIIARNLKHFVQCMAIEERYNFVKAVFIDKVHINNTDEVNYDEEEIKKMAKLYEVLLHTSNTNKCEHLWYRFAPFDIALSEIKNLIREEQYIHLKYEMLGSLAHCARSNMLHLRDLLQYYHDKHINDKIEYKNDFISDILSKNSFLKCDKNTWSILDDIFKSMDVYLESDLNNTNQNCIEHIIVYKVINNEQVPDIVEKKFNYDTLKQYGNKLNEDDKNKIFNYLYNYLSLKLKSTDAANENEFNKNVDLLYSILQTINDWGKEIVDYPILLTKIREYIILRDNNGWKTDLKKFYNINKSWRKHMFEESLSLNPSEEVCINALKHNPVLLIRYKNIVETMICNDKVSLKRLLRKLRIFWSPTLCKNFTNQYLNKLDQSNNHRPIVRGLCTILPKNVLQDLIQKYTPKEAAIDWSQADGKLISVQRNFAKNMHLGRPQPSPDAVLSYAKGDYLQYALPSLLAIFGNLSTKKSGEFILKLLDSRVSLQKHGLRLAVQKLKTEEIRTHFHNVWNATKNSTIRTILFQFTHQILCKEKDDARIQEFWKLLALFIDNLSYKEDKKIYELLGKVDQIPLSVRPEYVMKSYKFMKSFIPKAGSERDHYESLIDIVIAATKDLMVQKQPDFIAEILMELIPHLEKEQSRNRLFFKVMSAYLFISDEENRNERFKKIFMPFLQRCFGAWNETTKNHLKSSLRELRDDLKSYITDSNVSVPLKLFSEIQTEMEKNLTVPENYVLLTEWKLTTAFTKLLYNLDERKDWESICSAVAPEFGKLCSGYLKDDIQTHFPLIYDLFSRSSKAVMLHLFENTIIQVVCMNMLADESFVPAYLVALDMCSQYRKKDDLSEYIAKHPSVEIKMHYYSQFGNREIFYC